MANINANSELTVARELPVGMAGGIVLPGDQDPTWVDAPRSILRSAMATLGDWRISEVVAQFAERFKFNDHALALKFTDKLRLTEFFEKSRELFPDTTLEVVSLFENGNQAAAEWKLAATQTVLFGSMGYRIAIDLPGCTIVRVENGRIVEWSDYYDQSKSRRHSLAAFFTDWIEY